MTPLVLLHSLGSGPWLWEPQLGPWSARFEVLPHAVTAPPRAIDDIGRDLLALLDARGIDRAHVCGLSMGGQVAQWLGLHAPARVERIVLACTGARIGSAANWDQRIAAARAGGLESIADAVVERWFTPAFRAREPEAVARARERLLLTPTELYVACCEAVRDWDARAEVAAIRAPTLVVAGAHDPITPPADGHFLAEQIGAQLVLLDAAHLANIEAAGAFTAAVADFLGGTHG